MYVLTEKSRNNHRTVVNIDCSLAIESWQTNEAFINDFSKSAAMRNSRKHISRAPAEAENNDGIV